MTWPVQHPKYTFFPDVSGEELSSGSESEEEDRSLEVEIKCEKFKPNMQNWVERVNLSLYFRLGTCER